MSRRPAVTLIEVLVSMFIMAIGMLALLVLFPLGAVSMGQALKDDRCSSTASMAENVAIALNIRHDPNVLAALGTVPPPPAVFVDPYGAIQGMPVLGTTTIPRVSPSFVANNPVPLVMADRWFSLPDDITFFDNGTPNLSNGPVQRGLRYSYAYLLQRPQPFADSLVHLYVVVYSSRPVGTLTPEVTCSAATGFTVTAVAPNGLSITGNLGQPVPSVKFGSWILDTTIGNTPTFYRVVNVVDVGPNNLTLEVQPNFGSGVVGINSITIMDNVAEVFDKGTSWQP